MTPALLKKHRLYSIPDTHENDCLVATEKDCGQCAFYLVSKEVLPMDKMVGGFKKGIIKNSFIIVLMMSIIHTGIAFIHSRESGRADVTSLKSCELAYEC